MLLFDEDCGICQWSADRLLTWDLRGSLRASSIQGEEGGRLLADMDPKERLASWHLVTTDGQLFSAGAAVPPLMRLLPAGAPIAALASAFPSVTERVYGLLVRNRARLGHIVGIRPCAVDRSRGA